MYKKILVAIDGSKQSKKASMYGASLAEKCGAELTFLNVIQPLPLYLEMDQESILKKQKENANEVLEESIMDVEKFGIPVKADIIMGDPSEEITRKSSDYSLIVMGSRGLSLAAGMLLGSVTSRVCRRAACPVLVVR